MKRLARSAAAVAWPAFLVASGLEIGVFAFVDPAAVHSLGGAALGWSQAAIYSVAFFFFWAATAVACALTLMLHGPPSGDVSSRRR
jgi:hypothetical protein